MATYLKALCFSRDFKIGYENDIISSFVKLYFFIREYPNSKSNIFYAHVNDSFI